MLATQARGRAAIASATFVSGPSVSSTTGSRRRCDRVGQQFGGGRLVAPGGVTDLEQQPVRVVGRVAPRLGECPRSRPAVSIDPHATGTSSRPIAASRPRATSAPRGHRTSPVPDTVTASRSTSGRDVRYDSATMSSAARSVSTTSGSPAAGSLLCEGRWSRTRAPSCDGDVRALVRRRRHRRRRTPPAAAARPTRRARCRVHVVSRFDGTTGWHGLE